MNLTLINGFENSGGAIMNYGTLKLINCTFYNNRAIFDGAIYNYVGGTVIVENCVFDKNNATYDSGAIYNDRGSTLIVNNSKFINNIAGTYGGAITNFGTAFITNTILKNNSADITNNNDPHLYPNPFRRLIIMPAEGGCIFNGGTLTVNNCTFTDNNATDNGGAIWNDGTLSVNNSKFSMNKAGVDGGAIYNSGTFTAGNCTFMNNFAYYNGGAIYNSYNCTVAHSIFANNIAYTIFNEAGNSEVHFNRIIGHIQQLDVYAYGGSINAKNNWWNTNFEGTNPVNEGRVAGDVNVDNWVILSVTSNPKTINNGEKSLLTADLNHVNGTNGIEPLIGGHIPDGPITLNILWGSFTNPTVTHSITSDTVNGILTATFYAKEGSVNPAYNPVKVSATADDYTNNANESAYIKINTISNLYIQISTNKNNPNADETITITYKLGNRGPDASQNVTVNIPLPDGFIVNSIKGDGTWKVVDNTIIWTLETVPVGDPYLYISGKFPEPGNYSFGSSLSTEVLTIHVQNKTVPVNPEVKAVNEVISMQNTGMPLAPLALAILSIMGGIATLRRK